MNSKPGLASVTPPVMVAPGTDQWLESEEALSQEQLEHVHRRLRALCVLGRDAYACESYDAVAAMVSQFLGSLLNPERLILAVRAPEGPFAAVQSSGIEASADERDWPVSRNLLAKVRRDHLAILSTDAQEDARLKDFGSVNAAGIRSLLCVPLGTKEAPRGLVYLDSRLNTGVFNRHDLLFLTAVCRLLDLAIQSIDRKAGDRRRAEQDRRHIELLQEELFAHHKIVGQSGVLLEAYEKLKKIAGRTELPILLRGETGTGKELFARAAHWTSACREGPLVPVSLAAGSETLIESELFGHEKGAFTGADRRRIGLLEKADGGTLFLDEVADVPPNIQAKLLRILEEKVFARLGGSEPVRSHFRLVAATSRDLERMVETGQFRDDLYARLAGMTIRLPPLRERRDDIPLLVEYFLRLARLKPRFSAAAMKLLQEQGWPGNVRQLQYVVQATAALAEGATITPGELRDVLGIAATRAPAEAGGPLRNIAELLAETEKNHILRALDAAAGNATRAAGLIGMSKSTFAERRKRYDI